MAMATTSPEKRNHGIRYSRWFVSAHVWHASLDIFFCFLAESVVFWQSSWPFAFLKAWILEPTLRRMGTRSSTYKHPLAGRP